MNKLNEDICKVCFHVFKWERGRFFTKSALAELKYLLTQCVSILLKRVLSPNRLGMGSSA